MNRFFLFFFISFMVHLAMGAILLSRSNFFKGSQHSAEGSADINEPGTLPVSAEEPPVTDPSAEVFMETEQTPVEVEDTPIETETPVETPTLINVSDKPSTKPAKTSTNKKPTTKSTPLPPKVKQKQKKSPQQSVVKPAQKKAEPSPVKTEEKSPSPSETNKEVPQQDKTLNSPPPPHLVSHITPKPNHEALNDETQEWIDEEDRVLISKAPKTSHEEWVDEGEVITTDKKAKANWVDEDEIITAGEQQMEPTGQQKMQNAGVRENLIMNHQVADFQTPKPSPSPGNIAGVSPIPALDIGKARQHNQLKQLQGNPLPIYPQEALKKKWEGRVEIFYYVNPAGFVEKIQLKSSSGHRVLDNSALRALARYRYYPGQEGWVRHPVQFFLELDKEIKKTVSLGGNLRESTSQKE